MKSIIILVVLMLAAITVSYQFSTIRKLRQEIYTQKQKTDSLTHLSDSLHWELFPAQIELGRYQVAYEIFMERNPRAAEQYGTIISEETE